MLLLTFLYPKLKYFKMKKVKIILADDHQMFIDGMRIFLEKHDNVEIIGEAKNGNGVIEILEKESVDVVVLDINMPEMDGLEATKFIRKNYNNTKVLILSMFDNKETIIKLMRYGASGYILKNKTQNELYSALLNISQGRTHFGLEIMEQAVAVSNIDEVEEVTLTDREIEVLQKVAEGASSKEAAQALGISETTINTHRRNIMAKLELPSATHLVRYAIKHGFVKL